MGVANLIGGHLAGDEDVDGIDPGTENPAEGGLVILGRRTIAALVHFEEPVSVKSGRRLCGEAGGTSGAVAVAAADGLRWQEVFVIANATAQRFFAAVKSLSFLDSLLGDNGCNDGRYREAHKCKQASYC